MFQSSECNTKYIVHTGKTPETTLEAAPVCLAGVQPGVVSVRWLWQLGEEHFSFPVSYPVFRKVITHTIKDGVWILKRPCGGHEGC